MIIPVIASRGIFWPAQVELYHVELKSKYMVSPTNPQTGSAGQESSFGKSGQLKRFLVLDGDSTDSTSGFDYLFSACAVFPLSCASLPLRYKRGV